MKIFKRPSQLGKPRLAVAWRPDGLFLFLYEGARNIKCGRVTGEKTQEFLGRSAPSQTILVLPRSEVLQKEVAFAGPGGQGEDLEAKLSQLLPYSPKEMAYSLAVDPSESGVPSKGLLYAIPEEKINRILGSLERSGIAVAEVVSEDQTLFWLFQDKAQGGPILVFDQTDDRTLFLALKENAILLSRTYPREEMFKNVLSEASFALLEAGIKPLRAFVSGSIREEDAGALGIPIERFKPEEAGGVLIPAALSGAKKWGDSQAISLLPSERKLRDRAKMRNRFLKESLATFGLFIVCFTVLVASHLLFLKSKKSLLEKGSRKLASTVLEVRRMTASLAASHEAQRSKERLLSLLRELSDRAPSSIRLKELQVEDKSIVFQGESPSHTLLTETVQAFEKVQGVQEVKLEHARLRKRLNQDFFDFEVSARWQS